MFGGEEKEGDGGVVYVAILGVEWVIDGLEVDWNWRCGKEGGRRRRRFFMLQLSE